MAQGGRGGAFQSKNRLNRVVVVGMKSLFLRPLVILVGCCVVTLSPVAAAGGGDLSGRVQSANQAWLRKDYSKCQAILEGVVQNFGERRAIFGPKFGVIYYKKGMAELKLAHEAKRSGDGLEARRWFALAAESFRICYEDFPNDVQAGGE